MPTLTRTKRAGLLAAAASTGVVFVACAVLLPLALYPAWILACSVVTFAAYGYDKRAAHNHDQRVPELVLHALALAGGFPGAWLGRALFQHKTRKLSFTLVLTAATALHVLLWWRLVW